MKLHYKNTDKGIYLIKNKLTNQIYVGSTRNTFYNRFRKHISALRNNKHENAKLQNSWNKYGEANFEFIIHLVIKDDDIIILQQEEKLIKELNPYYNICLEPTKGGKPNLNRKLSESWKNNIRKKSRLYKHSDEILERLSENNKSNACKIEMTKDNITLNFNSWAEAAKHFNTRSDLLIQGFNLKCNSWHGWKINQLTVQKKKVKLYLKDKEIIFNSCSECDKFLKMFRGATSFYLKRDGEICGNKIELIN